MELLIQTKLRLEKEIELQKQLYEETKKKNFT